MLPLPGLCMERGRGLPKIRTGGQPCINVCQRENARFLTAVCLALLAVPVFIDCFRLCITRVSVQPHDRVLRINVVNHTWCANLVVQNIPIGSPFSLTKSPTRCIIVFV